MFNRRSLFSIGGVPFLPSVSSAPSQRVQWETSKYFFDYDRTKQQHIDAMATLGLAGWELVTIVHNAAWFKRPLL